MAALVASEINSILDSLLKKNDSVEEFIKTTRKELKSMVKMQQKLNQFIKQ